MPAAGQFKKGMRPWNKGLSKSIDSRMAKISAQEKGRHTNPSTEFKKGHAVHFPGWKKFSPAHLSHIQAANALRRGSKNPAHSERVKALWKSADFAAKQKLGRNLIPNKSEKNLECLLQVLFPGKYLFTGNFSFMIDGKNPDFVTTDGSKKIIEFFGERYHQKEDEQRRIDFFKLHGYFTLVVWEPELKDLGLLVEKLRDFQKV